MGGANRRSGPCSPPLPSACGSDNLSKLSCKLYCPHRFLGVCNEKKKKRGGWKREREKKGHEICLTKLWSGQFKKKEKDEREKKKEREGKRENLAREEEEKEKGEGLKLGPVSRFWVSPS